MIITSTFFSTSLQPASSSDIPKIFSTMLFFFQSSFEPHSSSLKSIKKFSLENKSFLTWKLQSFSAFPLFCFKSFASTSMKLRTCGLQHLLKRTRSSFQSFSKRYLFMLHLPFARLSACQVVGLSQLVNSRTPIYPSIHSDMTQVQFGPVHTLGWH